MFQNIYVDPVAAKAQWSPDRAKSGALKGRPVDLLSAHIGVSEGVMYHSQARSVPLVKEDDKK